MSNNKITQVHNIPIDYPVSKQELIDMVKKGRDRDEFCEELYYIEQLGGNIYFEEKLNVNFKKGIYEIDVPNKRLLYGTNQKKIISPRSFLSFIWEALEDFTLRILCLAAAASIIAHMATADQEDLSLAWIDGFAIFVAVIIAVLMGSINNYQKDQEFRRLNNLSDDRKVVSVIRDGEMKEIHVSNIVVGDVIKIFEGMELPTDGYIIEGHEITTDESTMTGETEPIKKGNLYECLEKRAEIIAEGSKNTIGKHDIPSPILLSGTKILTGDGYFIAIVVGEDSSIGQINALIQIDNEATPLQQKLEKIARDIGKFGLISGILTFILLIIRFLIERGQNNDWGQKSAGYTDIVDYFIIAITVLVVAIPEGLPLAVTLSLAFSVKKMLKDNNLVRKIEACETMGGANMICSDKTGTLTQNKMTLTNIWNGKEFLIDTNKEKDHIGDYIPLSHQELFIQAFGCNASATLNPEKGSKTDIAMLKFLEKCNVNIDDIKAKYLPNEDYIKFPFTSARKRQSIVIEYDVNGSKNGKRMHIKGASEFILQSCTQWHSFEDNSINPITFDIRNKIQEAIVNMADQALRTICIAYKEIIGSEDWKTHDDFGVYEVEKQNLILLGIIGIKDILRPEVPKAVEKCKIAGIKVRMVTGDNKLTARAIAQECGIIDKDNSNSLVLEGKEFQAITGGVVCAKCQTKHCNCSRNELERQKTGKPVRVDTIMHREEFKKIIDNLDVLAGSRPEDKYALVTGLMELGNVVAVTGDGTNDAPALKKANIGFAMGITGTEVSREAASIILLDDNFNSIVKAVLWGRNIYDSIRKFLQFQLTVNIVAVVGTIVGAALLRDEILKPVQMLWVNLIMDTLASLALATEPPRQELLLRKPHRKDDYIVSKLMTKHIITQSIYQLAIILIIVFAGDAFIPEYLEVTPNNRCQYYSDYGNGWSYVRSGRIKTINGLDDYTKVLIRQAGPSRHYTMVFNTFVLLQVFNFFNARKLQDEKNIFEGISQSTMFLIIVSFITILQLILGNLGGRPLYVSLNAMDIRQWVIAISFGFGSWIIAFIVKFINSTKLREYGIEGVDPKTKSRILGLKRNSEDNFQRKLISPLIIQNNNSRQHSLTLLTQSNYPFKISNKDKNIGQEREKST